MVDEELVEVRDAVPPDATEPAAAVPIESS